MPLYANEILKRVSITLHDEGVVRWPYPELLLYLSDAMTEIALHKPNAVTQTIELPLETGTVQELDENQISLVRVIRNIATGSADPAGRTGGKSITITRRTTLDSVMPDWQNPLVLPYTKEVDHVVQDLADPRTFYVVPGNDGTGIIEAVVAIQPEPLEEPNNPLDIASYADVEIVGIPSIFRNAIGDYVLYRAYSKDSSDPGMAGKAQAHFQLFANAIGLKTQTDTTTNLKTTKQTA